MDFNKLTKNQLVALANELKSAMEAMQWAAKMPRDNEWGDGYAEAFAESARWMNERFAKYV